MRNLRCVMKKRLTVRELFKLKKVFYKKLADQTFTSFSYKKGHTADKSYFSFSFYSIMLQYAVC